MTANNTDDIARQLYPAIDPFNTGHLRVSDTHEIYFEECGNPDGQAAVFVHGGPGAGCDESARQFFDPDHYRIVTFDQRGCGRSRPHACLEENTTWHLCADMEKLREHLPRSPQIATSITNSGQSILRNSGDVFDAHSYLPYDLPGAVGRAMDKIAPNLLLLEYTELWPQLIHHYSRSPF